MKGSPRRRLSQDTKRHLLNEAGGVCAMCGAASEILEISHVVALSAGGSDDPSNLVVLCPNCHRLMDYSGPTELHFYRYMSDLLSRHPDYSDIVLEALISPTSRYRADIIAYGKKGRRKEKLVIECKSFSVLDDARLAPVLARLTEYSKVVGDAHLVLAFPGRASERALDELKSIGVDAWDIDRIAHIFDEQIANSDDPYFRSIFFRSKERASVEERLIREIKECLPGHESWIEYQKLVGRVLEHLFCPPLTSALGEHSDASRINRRDFILPNYAAEGFWFFLRSRYGADYIVVDAKNGKGKVKKSHVLQIANYLKPHGVGMVGMILCRNGTDNGLELHCVNSGFSIAN